MITLNDVYKTRNQYKVLVKTITFNHSKYIQDTLNGIAMQITNFPFVNLVLEDHSTDGEQEVIKTWMEQECDLLLAEYYDIPTAEVIIAPHKSNANCTFAVYFHKENLFRQKAKREEQVNPWRTNSEYEAMCEGDDYWTDPLKLQKQVDFLEANLDVGLVYTMANIYNEENARIENYNYGMPAYCFDDLVRANCIPTLTVCYRRSLLERYNREVKVDSTWAMGDYPLWLFISMKTKIHFFDEVTSVYRFIPNSASHHSDINKQLAFYKSSSDICSYFIALAGRTDLYRVYRQKYFDIIVSTYISYGLPVPYDAVRQYWIWRPKSIIKYFLSKLSFLRKKS